jgi:hypothetical protein
MEWIAVRTCAFFWNTCICSLVHFGMIRLALVQLHVGWLDVSQIETTSIFVAMRMSLMWTYFPLIKRESYNGISELGPWKALRKGPWAILQKKRLLSFRLISVLIWLHSCVFLWPRSSVRMLVIPPGSWKSGYSDNKSCSLLLIPEHSRCDRISYGVNLWDCETLLLLSVTSSHVATGVRTVKKKHRLRGL